ncbi:MAG: histidine kinase [Ruminococcaceae bacterium]|nr:histidine kinase [Oscillospiraceae bacterium]
MAGGGRMTLRQKMGLLIAVIVALMLLSGAITIAVVSYSIDGMQKIFDDNHGSYNLQTAFDKETVAFANLIRDGGADSKSAFSKARANTAICLGAISADYDDIGEKRYEITWTIHNSYAQYHKQCEKLLAMSPDDMTYIRELYVTYSMQDYIKSYCGRLTETVLTQTNSDYLTKSDSLKKIPYIITGISLLAMLMLVVMLRSAMGKFTAILGKLADASQQIEQNNFAVEDVYWARQEDEIGQLVRAFNQMKHSTREYVHATQELHEQTVQRVELEKRFAVTQLQLIKSQLNPHFLFNTLNMIARMAQIEGAPVSEQMTVAMSNLLRYNLRTTEPIVPLEQELKVVEDYMYIQKMRFGSRIQYSVLCPDALLQTDVPVFLLQPLVENAVMHGLSNVENGGAIYVRARMRGDNLILSVADTGAGMTHERLTQVRAAMAKGGEGLGLGLGNVCRRITGFYPNGRVRISSKQGCGTVVYVEFAMRNKSKENDNGLPYADC